VSGAEDRSALEGWPPVGYSVVGLKRLQLSERLAGRAPGVGSDGHSGSLTSAHQVGVGMPVFRMPGISSRRG
jgi:hypothetical protein